VSDEIRETLNQRGANYGLFMDNAKISEQLYKIVREAPGWAEFEPDQKVATWIIFQKLARALSGRAQYDDNWRDIAGYAQLIVDRINGTGTYAEPRVAKLVRDVEAVKATGCCRFCSAKVGDAHKANCPTG